MRSVLYIISSWLVVFMLTATAQTSDTQFEPELIELRIPAAHPGTENLYQYFSQVLALGLSKMDTAGVQYKVVAHEIPMLHLRQLRAIDAGELDVIWSITDSYREQNFSPVYFPLMAGIFGYRVALVAPSQVPRFTSLSSRELQQMTAVQEKDWPDFKILKNNGYQVVAADYDAAFRLLERGYVDYFPRAVAEVVDELSVHHELALEPNQVLFYPNYMYFFLSAEQEALAEQLTQAINVAYQDGSLQQLFERQPFYQQTIQLLRGRTLHNLNVDLSRSTERIAQHPFAQSLLNTIKR